MQVVLFKKWLSRWKSYLEIYSESKVLALVEISDTLKRQQQFVLIVPSSPQMRLNYFNKYKIT